MQTYDLSRLNIMVVDDCEFSRRTISNVLRVLKTGKIIACKDGREAIEELKKSVENSAVRGQSSIDLVITDWLMEPVDGAMLVRWLRRSKESVNRFMPVIALSGAVDADVVNDARDLGVTEFIAKPFSIASVAKRLVTLIEQPRQFIYNGTYFGPDRRRKKTKMDTAERRIMNPDNIEIIYSGKNPDSLDTKASVWHFKLPNGLKGKFSGGASGGPGMIDPALLEAAEQHIQSMEDDYTDWVKDNIRMMLEEFTQLSGQPVNPWRHLKAINKIAHQMQGQGGTFGYNLITIFGKSLVECTSVKREITPNLLEFMRAHIDTIQAVIRDKIRGHGGQVGEAMTDAIEKARAKYGKPVAGLLEPKY